MTPRAEERTAAQIPASKQNTAPITASKKDQFKEDSLVPYMTKPAIISPTATINKKNNQKPVIISPTATINKTTNQS